MSRRKYLAGLSFETIRKQNAYKAGEAARKLAKKTESDERKTGGWGLVDLGKPARYKQPEYTRAYIRNEYKKLDKVHRGIFRQGWIGESPLPYRTKSRRKRKR